MAITTAMCTSFKKELMEAVHNFKNSGQTRHLELATLLKAEHLLA